MIYILLGKEVNILKDKIQKIINENNTNNIIKVSFLEQDLTDIIIEANYPSIFEDKKLIIVDDFSLKKLNEDDEKKFINFVNSNNENIIVFKCIDDKLDERRTITKLIKDKCLIENCCKLSYKELSKYVTDIFKKQNIKISFDQVKKILDLCEYNTDITIMEVNKLLLYKIGQNNISNEDIDKVISKNNEKELFELTESILKKDIKKVLNSYKILIDSNVDVTIILDSIAKQFRLLFQIKDMYGKVNEGFIANELEVNPYTIKKLIPYINLYKKEEIINKLYKLSELDINIKLSGYDKNKQIEMFFLTL